jgi:hypothetical protein
LLAKLLKEFSDTGKHRPRQVIGEQTRGDLTATLAHGVGQGVDPVARDAGAHEDRTRDLAIGTAIGCDLRPDHADVDSVHLAERGKHRLAHWPRGALQQRSVDIKQQKHGLVGRLWSVRTSNIGLVSSR